MTKLTDEKALSLVQAELTRQRSLWGVQDHPDSLRHRNYFASRAEEYKILYDIRTKNQEVTWDVILLEEIYEALELSHPATPLEAEKMQTELLQVAAVAISHAQAVGRRFE